LKKKENFHHVVMTYWSSQATSLTVIYTFLNTMTKLKHANNYNSPPCILHFYFICWGLTCKRCSNHTKLYKSSLLRSSLNP
jgi:hypothetical protein